MEDTHIIDAIREALYHTISKVYPELLAAESGFGLYDAIDQALFELIKEEYEKGLELKSIRQYILEKKEDYEDEASLSRYFSRIMEFAQYYRNYQNNQIIAEFGVGYRELEREDLSATRDRMTGHLISDISFFELKTLCDYPIFKKILWHKMGNSNNVSNEEFKELFARYSELNILMKEGMTTPKMVIEKTQEYFTLEWKYNINLFYQLSIEAESLGRPRVKKMPVDRILLLCGVIKIPPTWWLPCILTTQSRMLVKRNDYCKAVFQLDDEGWFENIITIIDACRLKDLLKADPEYNLKELLAGLPTREKSNFIQKHYWIWNQLPRFEWTDDRIHYMRMLFRSMIQNIPAPKIK